MLAIQKRSKPDTSTVNILPCRLQHNGTAKVTKRHWTPFTDSDGSKQSYFRGRKLRGRDLTLPSGYTGIVVKSTDRVLPKMFIPVEDDDSDIEEEQESDPIRVLESATEFNHVTVWGHDELPPTEDPFVKGVDEWIAFAHAVHSAPAPDGGDQSK